MRSFEFDVVEGRIVVHEYPGADQILTLPDGPLVRQHKDMTLHMMDELTALIKKQYGDKAMSAFKDFPPLQVEISTKDKLFEKRY